MQQEYRNIGKLVATYGINGELILSHQLGQPLKLQVGEPLFIEQHHRSFIPYFVKNASIKNEEETIVLLEDIETKEQAAVLLKKEIYVPVIRFNELVAGHVPLALLGFTVIDNDRQQELGTVEEVIEMPHQVLIKINYRQKEVLLPVNESTLIKTDKEKIWLSLPEGLLDIYLE